jgi:hypothetical protein
MGYRNMNPWRATAVPDTTIGRSTNGDIKVCEICPEGGNDKSHTTP